MKLNLPFILLCSVNAFAQVGINTELPKSTMDIVAKNPFGTSTNADGLLVPRIDRLRALNMTPVENSTLIFVNNISTGTATGQASNITSTGYYYYDSVTAKWIKLNSGSASAGDSTVDAFIDNPSSTRVELGTKSDGTTLRDANTAFVIKDSGYLGVGTDNPTSGIHLVGVDDGYKDDIRLSSYSTTATGPGGNFLFVANRGTPTTPLNLSNNDKLGQIHFHGRIGNSEILTSGISANYKGDGTTNLSNLSMYTSGSVKMTVDPAGQVGVGTQSPSQLLHVAGNTRLEGNVYDGNNSAGTSGKVLSSDGSKVVWLNNTGSTPAVFAVLNSAGYSGNNTSYQATGASIVLPPGKWIVNTNVLLKCTNAPGSTQAVWVRLTWSSTSGGFESTDIVGGPFASGSLVGPSEYGMATGSIIINNTTAANKTYYLSKGNHQNYSFTCTFDKLGSNTWSENNIIAFPAN